MLQLNIPLTVKEVYMAQKRYVDTYIVGSANDYENDFSNKLQDLKDQLINHFGSDKVAFNSDVKRKDQVYTYIDLEYHVEEE